MLSIQREFAGVVFREMQYAFSFLADDDAIRPDDENRKLKN